MSEAEFRYWLLVILGQVLRVLLAQFAIQAGGMDKSTEIQTFISGQVAAERLEARLNASNQY